MKLIIIIPIVLVVVAWLASGWIAFRRVYYPAAASRQEWWRLFRTRPEDTIFGLLFWLLMGPIALKGTEKRKWSASASMRPVTSSPTTPSTAH